MSNTLWPQGLQPIKILCLWNSPGKNAGLGSQSLFEGTFLTQDPTWVACTAGNLLGFEVISSLDTFQIKLMLTSECKSLGLRFYFCLVSRIVIDHILSGHIRSIWISHNFRISLLATPTMKYNLKRSVIPSAVLPISFNKSNEPR